MKRMKSQVLALCVVVSLGQMACGGVDGEVGHEEDALGESSGAIIGSTVSFNGGTSSDLLWRDQSTGNMLVWIMSGPSLSGTAVMPAVSPSLTIQAASNFGGPTPDPDLVYQATVPGGEAIRFLSNSFTVLGMSPQTVLPSSSWYIAASGDFNADGQTDLVVHNRTTGQYFYRYMSGPSSLGNSAILTRALPWFIVGAADMNGDGRTDLLWRNRSTGQNEIALMNNLAVIGVVTLPVQSLAFYVGATADYTADGRVDIAWHNPSTGQVQLWRMAGTSFASALNLGMMGSGCPAWFSQSTPPPAVGGCRYLVGPR